MYAMDGFATAFGEITLVLFTTLAPTGVMAYALMALPFVVIGPRLDEAARRNIDRHLSIPLVVARVGLVASATHLGNPANALYVLAGFGRSPLSNEVVCGVAFLGSAGVFWLTSFSEQGGNLGLRRAAAVAVSVLGLVFVGAIALAYDADTIITWSNPYAPLSVWLNALVGGPLLALLGLRMARFATPAHWMGLAYLGVATVACVANVVLYLLWGAALPTIGNAMTTANGLAPFFGPMTAVFAALCALGIYLGARAVGCQGETPLWVPIASSLCALAGIFVMRFSFYMIHMTVGLGV